MNKRVEQKDLLREKRQELPKSLAKMATVYPSWANLRAMDRPSFGPTPTMAAMPLAEVELTMLRILGGPKKTDKQ